MKRIMTATAGSRIVINPKIDSKKQRRIQCSLPFRDFWECSGRDAQGRDCPELFGFPFGNPILSSARKFKRDPIRE